MERTIAAGEARGHLNRILDDAENGIATLILRHSKPSAAVVPASEMEAFRLFQRLMREVGETLEVSEDPEIIAAVLEAQDQISHGHIVWH
jgi:PHD/YefM family antitoxin component YafN of YafNO toxin-antitoxin module